MHVAENLPLLRYRLNHINDHEKVFLAASFDAVYEFGRKGNDRRLPCTISKLSPHSGVPPRGVLRRNNRGVRINAASGERPNSCEQSSHVAAGWLSSCVKLFFSVMMGECPSPNFLNATAWGLDRALVGLGAELRRKPSSFRFFRKGARKLRAGLYSRV
jgi:hypothetical protein